MSRSEGRVWDRLAGRYDIIVRLFDTSYPVVRERIRRDLRGCGRVLEVAAGTGQFTPELARVAGALVATDLSPEMVVRLQARLDAEGLGNVQAAVMSAYALDVADGSFDAVFCANVLHVMDDPQRALREVRRALTGGGLLVAPTFLHGADGLRRALSRAASLLSPFVAHARLDLRGLRSLVAAAGFEVLAAEQLPGLFPLGYVLARKGPDGPSLAAPWS